MTAWCRRAQCGRPLRSEKSKRRGYGPVCWRRMIGDRLKERRLMFREGGPRPEDPDQIPLPLDVSTVDDARRSR
ncbi:DUF6011 domain-containing protein [Amycolatopsis sp. FU40]|uniref:DUF6011 domain-containing protein n=1 Tax=Amycolatopsis sp. FU40 TaxID=2914159 RepID=UPI001F46E86A|nr:DUF6011 domain-containing protein [Amycolatopsis sp. FU40]UKD55124.1 DUF6011 domain-containing protein [Amycolatopsis sp. FU40]